ncbi:hypothetical protein ONE63_008928 [Megalurothrips usitatus]|uniref:Zinc transporter ZIP14 n=1 Tax=Megalurothrips usitatus TaxID=439358 RepID=A0AAV7XHZ2_9NEOP|nr:hypothetical protein ONE63_008928 [Megalurothrips usitatus]
MAVLAIYLCVTSLLFVGHAEVTPPHYLQNFLDHLSNCSFASRKELCLTPEELFKGIDVVHSPSPQEDSTKILMRLAEAKCYDGKLPSVGPKEDQKSRPAPGQVWGMGILFVTIISLCSLLGVSVMPLMDKAFYKQALTLLIGLAVGSLSASSLFHLIPQAFSLVDNDSHHEYLSICLYVWGGIWVFFMVERILKIIHDCRETKQKKEKVLSTVSSISSPGQPSVCLLPARRQEEGTTDSCMHDASTIYDCQEQVIKASFGHAERPHPSHNHSHTITFDSNKDSAIATVAWMVIFGDGLHNFIDGLSIGAAFNKSILTGISISVAVVCEEFPHELGDFAVLLNAGMSIRQALLYNFLSACTCYLGLVVGIVLGEFEASTYIFGFAGGMFLYISLVDMVPEMNEVAEEASKVSWQKALQTLFLQNVGMLTGVSVLYLLARYQDHINFS